MFEVIISNELGVELQMGNKIHDFTRERERERVTLKDDKCCESMKRMHFPLYIYDIILLFRATCFSHLFPSKMSTMYFHDRWRRYRSLHAPIIPQGLHPQFSHMQTNNDDVLAHL